MGWWMCSGLLFVMTGMCAGCEVEKHNPTHGAVGQSVCWTTQTECHGCTTRCPAQRSSETAVRSARKVYSTVACMH